MVEAENIYREWWADHLQEIFESKLVQVGGGERASAGEQLRVEGIEPKFNEILLKE